MQFRVVVVLLSLSFLNSTSAQEPNYSEMAKQINSRITFIRGSENPEGISLNLKMQLFFQNYHAHYAIVVNPYLTAADRAKVEAFIRATENHERANRQVELQANAQLCADLNNKGVVQASIALENMSNQVNANSETRFRNFLNSLTPGGRDAIENHIAAEVTPNMVQSSVSTPSLVEEFPEFYRAQFDYICNTSQDERDKAFDELIQLEEDQNAASSSSSATDPMEIMGTVPE